MRILLTAVLFIIFSFLSNCFGQDSAVDSLKSEITRFENAGQWMDYAKTSKNLNRIQTRVSLEEAYAVLEKHLSIIPSEEKEALAYLLHRKAQVQYFFMKEYKPAIQTLNRILELLEGQKTAQAITSIILRGTLTINIQEYEKGIQDLLYAYELIESGVDLDNPCLLINLCSNIMAAYNSIGDIDQALEWGRIGISKTSICDEDFENGKIHLNFGSILVDQEFNEEAAFNLSKAEEMLKTSGQLWILTSVHALQATILLNEEKYTEALQLYQKAVILAQEHENKPSEAAIYQDIAFTYSMLKDYDQAVYYIDKQIAFCESEDVEGAVKAGYIQKANYLLSDNQLDSAKVYTQKAFILGETLNDINGTMNAHELLSKIHAKEKNFEKALFSYQSFHALHDSIYSDNLNENLAEEATKQNVVAAEEAKTNAELEARLLSSQNKLYIGLALALGAILVIGGFLYLQLRKTRRQLEDQNAQLKDLNATKDKFFSIIAHDIRNPITALQGVGEQIDYYINKNDSTRLKQLTDSVDDTSNKLSDLLNNLLNWALLQTGMIPYRPEKVSIHSAVSETFSLLEHQAISKEITLVNKTNVEDLVNADGTAVITIIRNLVNNGLKFTSKGGEISVGTTQKDGQLFINVNDTGTGISAEKIDGLFDLEGESTRGTSGEKGTGLGLVLCKELIELNKGTIKVLSEIGKGSSFVFSLPKK